MTTQKKTLDDTILKDVAKGLVDDWYKVGVYLGVTSELLEAIRDRKRVHAERWPVQMLRTWQTKRSKDMPELIQLSRALSDIGRNDLVYILRRGYDQSPSDETDPLLLETLGERLIKDWYTLGLHLGLPSHTLDRIEMEDLPAPDAFPAKDMLVAWREAYNGTDIIRDLMTALRRCRRLDLVQLIDKYEPRQMVVSEEQDQSDQCPRDGHHSEYDPASHQLFTAASRGPGPSGSPRYPSEEDIEENEQWSLIT